MKAAAPLRSFDQGFGSTPAISNAEADQREVHVTTGLCGAAAEIKVGDTGPGIAADDLKNVFNPFFTAKPHGVGMGLVIVRTVVEAHHGQVLAKNQVLGGALFTIRLPIARGRKISASSGRCSCSFALQRAGNVGFP